MAAAQNFTVVTKNHTALDFEPGKPDMDHGGVYDEQNIKAGTTTVPSFMTRGDNNASAGTEGKIVYTSTDGNSKITFKWDIPWGLGDDFLKVSVTGPIKLERSKWSGGDIVRKTVTLVVLDDKPIL